MAAAFDTLRAIQFFFDRARYCYIMPLLLAPHADERVAITLVDCYALLDTLEY